MLVFKKMMRVTRETYKHNAIDTMTIQQYSSIVTEAREAALANEQHI